MKKIVTIAVFFFAFLSLTQRAQAQKYLSFESKSFSVMLKCSPDYNKVLDISFSENGAWVPYKLVKTLPLENKTANGNIYVVEDAKSVKYSVEYMFEKDNDKLKTALCAVVNQKTHVRTSLQRKK